MEGMMWLHFTELCPHYLSVLSVTVIV